MTRRLRIPPQNRRGFLTAALGLVGTASLGACDRFAITPTGQRTLKVGEDANLFVQRLLLTPASLAQEFPDGAISPWFKPNGTIDPEDKPYKALAAGKFETFKLRVDGLVERPLDLSLAELRALPARTQTTRHDCVEGWSAIGKWTGVPLAEILRKAGLKPQARYVVFHCADTMEFDEGGGEPDAADASDAGSDTPDTAGSGAVAWGGETGASKPAPSRQDSVDGSDGKSGAVAWGGSESASQPTRPDTKATGNPSMQSRPEGEETQDGASAVKADAQGGAKADASGSSGARAPGPRPIRYYESIDLTDAYHPQTILAYALNGKTLPVSNGAPLRLRVERQLGYKQAKYIMRIEVADSLAAFGDGKGGYWEDRGYEWYAGI